MTPALLVVGSLLVFWAATFVTTMLPAATMEDEPSDIWRPWTAEERRGHELFVANGCSYCHSSYVRPQDWGLGAWRVAQPGDYHGQEPAILGTERTGPDLSEEGGLHPDDWHVAHFLDPRSTRPLSVMPAWGFLDDGKPGLPAIRALTAFVQAQGGKDADARMARQRHWKALALEAHARGPDANVEWLHAQIPRVWREMPNPYPADAAALSRGKAVYQQFCISCHGPIGDGQGEAARWLDPPPLNFTTLKRHLVDGRYIGGIFYYQIMNGVTGTAMPYFKTELESEKIWDVSSYVAVTFVGHSDANAEPEGIDASYEPVREVAPDKAEGTHVPR